MMASNFAWESLSFWREGFVGTVDSCLRTFFSRLQGRYCHTGVAADLGNTWLSGCIIFLMTCVLNHGIAVQVILLEEVTMSMKM